MSRGYFGIAIYQGKNIMNFGTLMRTGFILDASFIAIIGKRFKRQCSDTYQSHRHIPTFEYSSFEEFKNNLPVECRIIAVEMESEAIDLKEFNHPQQAVYLLGSEDEGLPKEVISKCHKVIKLKGERSMNMAVAGSIVLYHRECL